MCIRDSCSSFPEACIAAQCAALSASGKLRRCPPDRYVLHQLPGSAQCQTSQVFVPRTNCWDRQTCEVLRCGFIEMHCQRPGSSGQKSIQSRGKAASRKGNIAIHRSSMERQHQTSLVSDWVAGQCSTAVRLVRSHIALLLDTP